MKFSISWLAEHLNGATLPAPAILAETLTKIGFEVESVKDFGEVFKHFQTAKIVEAAPHPDADRLQICKVEYQEGKDPLQIVCGAPNARTGLHVILARPGAYVPAGDFVIKEGSIRGVKSQGMLCSWGELNLAQDGDGIAELPEGTSVGVPLAEFKDFGGAVLEIGVTPNRGDVLGVKGIARELSAAGLGGLKSSESRSMEEGGVGEISVACNVEGNFLAGRVIEKVKNGETSDFIADRLRQIDKKTQGMLIDVTNYAAFDLGRPMHAYDADKIAGALSVDSAREGESFVALNDETYTLKEGDVVIRDGAGKIAALAGIIGAKDSAVSDQTNRIFLESAYFDPRSVSRTARRLRISTDAGYRFERGVDATEVLPALNSVAALIKDAYPQAAVGSIVQAGTLPSAERTARIEVGTVADILGVELSAEEVKDVCVRLGFVITQADENGFTLSVPSWRNDIASPANVLARAPGLPELSSDAQREIDDLCVAHEIAGEIARHADFEAMQKRANVEEACPALKRSDATREFDRNTALRHLCASRGLNEIVGFSFINKDASALFEDIKTSESLLNPLSRDLAQMRPTLMPNLLQVLKNNRVRGLGERGETCFFEIGSAFGAKGVRTCLAGVRGGYLPRDVDNVRRRTFTWQDAKEDALNALEELGVNIGSLRIEPTAPHYYHPGRSGALMQGPKKCLGYFGQIHPDLRANFDLDEDCVGFEIELDAIKLPKARKASADDLGNLQPVRKDMAFIVDDKVTVGDLIRTVEAADRKHISDIRVFDVFTGGTLEKGRKSIALEIVFVPQKETFTDEAFAKKISDIAQAVSKNLGGVLRDK